MSAGCRRTSATGSCKSEKSTNEMAVADMGKAPTAVRKPKNQKSRDITTFEEGPNTSERNRHVAAQPTAASAAGIQASDIYFLVDSLVSRIQKREIEPTLPAAQNYPREN